MTDLPRAALSTVLLSLVLATPAPAAEPPGAAPEADTRAASPAASPGGSAEGEAADPAGRSPAVAALMLALLLTAFVSMTAYNVPLPLAMALVACAFLALQTRHAEEILKEGFMHYSEIVLLFTAVAIPAHMIERSHGFEKAAADLGYRFGRMQLRRPRLMLPAMIVTLLGITYVTAGLMHNVTSILIMTPIVIRMCDSFQIPSRWILCGALVASNLGGFSTKWGDTPNIVESKVWGLAASDFWREVLPANLIVLAALCAVVTALTRRTMRRRPSGQSLSDLSRAIVQSRAASGPPSLVGATGAAGWAMKGEEIWLDKRLLWVGVTTLAAFIVAHVVWDQYKFQISALTILTALMLERSEDRFHTLKSLGFDVYLAFAAIFVLAGCVEHSYIGLWLREQISNTGAAPWAIAVTGYLGTTFTEAASWATAASEPIFHLQGGDELVRAAKSHSAAWALGGGICAGSSSLITAASAGIILWEESGRFKEKHEVTFRRYLPFGLGFSLFMLVFYGTYFTLLRYEGADAAPAAVAAATVAD